MLNNAGMVSFSNTMDISLEEWDRVMQVNVTSALLLSKKVAPIMKEKGKGSIINTGSIAGISAKYGPVAYCTSKHALNGITKALAREFGPQIRVNAILPGAILTAMVENIGGEAALSGMIEATSLKRIGTGKEIGTTALFSLLTTHLISPGNF